MEKIISGCIAINDDTPIVYNIGNEFHICGSPWSGKTEINANISIPLKAIVCLKQDSTNHIERISPKVSIPFLLHEIKASPLKQREENKLNILSDLVSSTNIYMLGCLPDDEAAIICKEKYGKRCDSYDKRIISTILLITVAMFSCVTAFAADVNLSDIDSSHWAYAAISELVTKKP